MQTPDIRGYLLVAVIASVASCGFHPQPKSGTLACGPGGAACCPPSYVCVGRGIPTAGGPSSGVCWSEQGLPPEALASTHDYTPGVVNDPACTVTDWLPPGVSWPVTTSDAGALDDVGEIANPDSSPDLITSGRGSGESDGGGGRVVTIGSGQIAAGLGYTCAVVNGGARCWGYNNVGQLGVKTGKSRLLPVQVVGLESGVTAITTGRDHTCAIVNGGLQCWGSNFNGQLGNNTTTLFSVLPVQVVGLESGVTAVSAGDDHTCAVVKGGVQCWGGNRMGQLGDNTQKDSSLPVPVTGLKSGVTAVSAGGEFTCAVVKDGVQCWGGGQIGDGSLSGSHVPVQVLGPTSGVTAVVTGAFHGCALVAGGMKCWGVNSFGQLGNNTQKDSSFPVQVTGLKSGVKIIATGSSHTCALVDRGMLCWGSNGAGQLGDNTTTMQRNAPVQVTGLADGVSAIAAGTAHTCALVNNGMQCWGDNPDGALGNNTTTASLTPVQVQFQ